MGYSSSPLYWRGLWDPRKSNHPNTRRGRRILNPGRVVLALNHPPWFWWKKTSMALYPFAHPLSDYKVNPFRACDYHSVNNCFLGQTNSTSSIPWKNQSALAKVEREIHENKIKRFPKSLFAPVYNAGWVAPEFVWHRRSYLLPALWEHTK